MSIGARLFCIDRSEATNRILIYPDACRDPDFHSRLNNARRDKYGFVDSDVFVGWDRFKVYAEVFYHRIAFNYHRARRALCYR